MTEDQPTPQRRRDFGFLPIPSSARVAPGPDGTVTVGYGRVIAFAFASTFTGMNLYYCQPILVQLAQAFNVNDLQVSRIPTLLQAGYATGLLLLSPLGDIVRRRQLVLLLIVISGSLTIGLAITHSLVVFEVLSFLTAIASVTPQVLIPLTTDLAPPNRRATYIALVLAGLLTGVLLARVLSGIIAQFSSYRNIYWMGVGGQFLLAVVLWLLTPDVPVKNTNLSYFQIMQTMAKFAVTEPALVQGSIVLFCSSAVFSGFWVTMTFLLNGAPYHYSTIVIGLFGLVGMFGISMAPVVGRLVDGLVPWMATLVAILFVIASQLIQTFAGEISIGAVVIATILLDIGIQATQVSLTTAIFSIAPEARARLNAVLILAIFLGQVMGTSVGTKLYVESGYKLGSGIRVVFGGVELLVLLLRGPHVPRKTWIGWAGGMNFRKLPADSEAASPSATVTPPTEEMKTEDESRPRSEDK